MDAKERYYTHEDTSPILLTPSQWILLVQADAERPCKITSEEDLRDAYEMQGWGNKLVFVALVPDGALVHLTSKGIALLNSAGPNEVFDVLQELANETG